MRNYVKILACVVLSAIIGSCTTITTISIGDCDFYISPDEPVTLTYDIVKACQALGEEVRIFTIESPAIRS
jgi:hypothetical protein